MYLVFTMYAYSNAYWPIFPLALDSSFGTVKVLKAHKNQSEHG